MTQEFEAANIPSVSGPRPLEIGRTSSENWERLREALRVRLSTQAYATWVVQMMFVSDDGHTLTISLPDQFGHDWVTNHYRHVLDEELRKISEESVLDLVIIEQPEDTNIEETT